MACSSSSSIQSVFGGFESCEPSIVLLMTLMEEEETQLEDHYQNCYEDERLVSMIQSLEAEINSGKTMLMEQMDGQDFSTSSSSVIDDDYDWVMDMEVVPSMSSPFDDDSNDAWSSPWADMNEDYYSDQFRARLVQLQAPLTMQ